MPKTEAQKRANKKWMSTQRQICVMVNPAVYEKFQTYAASADLSLRGFMLTAANEYISAHPISPAKDEPT